MRHNLKWLLPVLSVLSMVAYLTYTWGLWGYIFSVSGPMTPSPNAQRSDDTFFKAQSSKGTVLLIHGLNFDASKMHPLAQVFLAQGYSVLVPRLVGHRGRIDETLSIPTQFWIGQFREWEATLPKPLICVGYSLGGLLVTERSLKGELNCDRLVLFAPAFALRTPSYLVEFLEKMTPSKFTVASGIPTEYMHFDHPGLGPTFALVQILQSLLLALPTKTPMPPALVFIDPNDKVIAPADTINLIHDHFAHWKIVELHALNLPEKHAFHLIVDEPHVGTRQWKMMSDEIAAFVGQ